MPETPASSMDAGLIVPSHGSSSPLTKSSNLHSAFISLPSLIITSPPVKVVLVEAELCLENDESEDESWEPLSECGFAMGCGAARFPLMGKRDLGSAGRVLSKDCSVSGPSKSMYGRGLPSSDSKIYSPLKPTAAVIASSAMIGLLLPFPVAGMASEMGPISVGDTCREDLVVNDGRGQIGTRLKRTVGLDREDCRLCDDQAGMFDVTGQGMTINDNGDERIYGRADATIGMSGRQFPACLVVEELTF